LFLILVSFLIAAPCICRWIKSEKNYDKRIADCVTDLTRHRNRLRSLYNWLHYHEDAARGIRAPVIAFAHHTSNSLQKGHQQVLENIGKYTRHIT